jgi:predicted RNA binding protein YcfA (HicA-like mRNA interferase family)
MPVTVREAIRIIEAAGWLEVAQRGSHRQFKHPQRTGRVTIAGKPQDDLHPKTWKSIQRQAGIGDE